jgi:hypothetical protein
MNCYASKIYSAAKLLTVVSAFTAFTAHGQQGVLEFHGVVTSPGCNLKLQNVAILSQQAHINGQTRHHIQSHQCQQRIAGFRANVG